jgi:hypothetical protein
MYAGAFIGFLIQAFKGRRGGFPKKRYLAVFGVLLVLFGIDGVNSYMRLVPIFQSIYEPNNVFRLLTGTGVGVAMAAVLMPIVHQSLWVDWNPSPAIESWRDLFILLASAFAVSSLMLTGNPLLLYPLALVSAATVVLILGLIYTIIWIMIFKKENTFTRWIDSAGYLGLGFSVAILQILVIDLARLIFTGTWNGFNF